jgi:hypothetical protein
MADNSDDPVMQNQDVVQGGRAVRSNSALLASAILKSAPNFTAPLSDDPNIAALATHNEPGAQGGKTVARSKPSAALALADAMAPAASAPMPPVRPTDLDAINALASPPGASAPMDPSIAARTSAMANPPGPIANAPVGSDPWMSGATSPAGQPKPWDTPMQNLAPVASQGGSWESLLPAHGDAVRSATAPQL